MKNLFLFSTKIYVYLIELPLILVLIGAIRFNGVVTNLFGLYPLIVCSILAIIFVLIYFFNPVMISYSRIKQFGVFSSRDSAIITKDTTLILTYFPRRKIRIELFAVQEKPALEFMSGENYTPQKVNVFRERVIGRDFTAMRVLKFFGLEKSRAKELISSDKMTFNTEEIEFSTDIFEGRKIISINFLKTI